MQPKHYALEPEDSFTIPPDCIARIYKRGKNMGIFSFVYHHALEEAGTRCKDATKTLIQLMALPDFENVIYVDTASIAAKVGVTRTAVQQHIAKLREEGLIIPHEDAAPSARVIMKWRLCPFLGWKGTAKALEKYLTTLTTNHSFFQYVDPEFRAALIAEARREEEENSDE
jgi:DNA-binding transcriptional ArsR family regulator